MNVLLLGIILMNADPGLPAWTSIASGSLIGACLVTVVVASATGFITWPPEKKRMQATIDMLTAALAESNANVQRALPATARVVELVEQRVVQQQPPGQPSRAELLAALREVASGLQDVVGDE